MTNSILEIKDLTVRFSSPRGEVLAAERVNLCVARGSFTALVGESGSGKTVTALSICRLVKPSIVSGEIFHADSKNLLLLNENELRKVRGREISYIFQDPASSLNPVMTVGEQVAEAFRAHFRSTPRQAQKKVLEFFDKVKLKDPSRVYDSFPHELSGGMKQRVMIAMALISGPSVLVADEPTTALDPETESGILELLEALRRERGLAVLFITQNLPLAARFADAIYVMRRGRVVERLEKGTAPREEYTQKLFSASLVGVPRKSFIKI